MTLKIWAVPKNMMEDNFSAEEQFHLLSVPVSHRAQSQKL